MGSLAKATLLFHLRTPTSHNRRNAYVKTSNELVENMVEFKLLPRRYIWNNGQFKSCEDRRSKRGCLSKVNAFPDWHVMAVLVQHMEGQRDLITHKSIWHLNDETIKNVYTIYVMFTCWGCCFFGAMKDPYYDSEEYRGEGGDGTGHWVYEKQEDIEESNRAELWREELIEEIEQKVGGLRELEEAGKKEELVK